jgi:ADP-ribosylglycohydrolase
MTTNGLLERIYGGLLGMAVGDALGGPVEGLSYEQIQQKHGCVSTMLPYQKAPSEHAQFSNQPGSYTDDTRLALIYCDAILQAGGSPVRGDLAKALADYHYTHTEELERSFIEEYYLKGLYGSRKLIYGGQPTNGAVMSIAPVGLLHPADPKAAFELAYELSFVTDGYAKESAAIAAAAIAEAMRPGVSVEQIVRVSLETAAWFRREGTLWPKTVREREWARFEGRPNDILIGLALEAAEKTQDVFALPELLYPKLLVSPVGSEAGQTLAVAFAMLVAANGDFSLAVQGAVNYGRDCDSYATVVGAIAGAMQGSSAIPAEWGNAVLEANPHPDLRQVATDLCNVVTQQHLERQATVHAVQQLLT